MSSAAKKEYLEEIKKRYSTSSKKEKSLILDQFCITCRFNRKYAIRLIGKGQQTHNTRKGRPKKYHSTAIIDFLKTLWMVTNLACSQRLKAATPLWLPYYLLHHKNILTTKEEQLLLEISPRTIDRLLKRLKSKYQKFGLSTTKPGSLLKNKFLLSSTNGMNLSRDLLRQTLLHIAVVLLPGSLLTL